MSGVLSRQQMSALMENTMLLQEQVPVLMLSCSDTQPRSSAQPLQFLRHSWLGVDGKGNRCAPELQGGGGARAATG